MLLTLAVPALVVPCNAQFPRQRLSALDAAQLEANLKANPNDRNARRALLDYYYLSGVNPGEAVPARRRHIVWFIENAPDDPALSGSAATIDPAGHSLADPLGFQRASEAWRAQISKPGVSATALVNAAYFFKLFDKDLTMKLLERAVEMEPSNKEFGARLGDQYALAIMGVTMINKNGYPLQAEPKLTQSPAAAHARQALTTSRNPYALAKAGYMLAWQGAILYAGRKLDFDPSPMGKDAVERAANLAPGETDIAAYLDQFNEIQKKTGRSLRAQMPRAGTSPAVLTIGAGSLSPASPSSTTLPRTSTPPAAIAPSPADLSKVTVGMSREELLKLGPPAGRISFPEAGHLMETYQYVVDGKTVGRIRLTDGVVSSVDLK
jgi:hypothetical protein